MSTLDDTASMAVKTSAKVSAAAVDDIAATPQYVTGITPDREIPIIKRITLGSVRNKLGRIRQPPRIALLRLVRQRINGNRRGCARY